MCDFGSKMTPTRETARLLECGGIAGIVLPSAGLRGSVGRVVGDRGMVADDQGMVGGVQERPRRELGVGAEGKRLGFGVMQGSVSLMCLVRRHNLKSTKG